MQTLLLEPGDLLQIKSTDLPSGQFVKLQAQSTSFLDISDPKAVLENAFRNFSCLTRGDIFTFSYNDQTYEMAVLETKPETDKNAIGVLETDLEVDFAPPVGYEEPKRPSGASTPRSVTGGGLPAGGVLHTQGSMAQAINYSSIAPASSAAAKPSRRTSSSQATNSTQGKAARRRLQRHRRLWQEPRPTPRHSRRTFGGRTGPSRCACRRGNCSSGMRSKRCGRQTSRRWWTTVNLSFKAEGRH